MTCYVTEVVEANYQAQPQVNKAGVKYPRHYAWVKMPWRATAANPDPITPHPIPVFLNHYHTPDKREWQPLPVGTRVVVAPVNRSPHNPVGLAVIAYGPQNTDDQFDDLRETATYQVFDGNAGEDRYVDAPSDPVFGPNEDVGRTHLDGRGYGWQTRHPYPGDAMRDIKTTFGPGTVTTEEKRLDDSVVRRQVVHTGPTATYTFTFDGLAGQATLQDDKGNSLVLDSNGLSWLVTAVTAIGFTAPNMGFFGATPVPQPVVTGSTVAQDGATTPALASLIAALKSLGLIA